MSSAPPAPARKTPGFYVYAAVLMGLGVLGLANGDFPSIWLPVAKDFPGRLVLVYLCAFVSLAGGFGLVRRNRDANARASAILLLFMLAWFLLYEVPHMAIIFAVGTWWAAGKGAAMAGAAWVAFVFTSDDSPNARFAFAHGERGLRIARALQGAAFIPWGIAHFLYMQNTAPLIPKVLGWPEAWAYFTGAAFIAGGLAMITGVLGRLASALVALQIGLFTVIIWVPIVLGNPKPYDWSEFITSIVLTACAWIVADSYRRPVAPRL